MYHFELKPFRTNWNPAQEEQSFSPAFEIVEQEKSFAISIDIPGVRREDLDIEVKEDYLYVTGERKSEQNNVLRSERRYGKFSKVFTMPKNVNTEAIEAQFENGVLTLVIPKEEKSLTKKITIRGPSSGLN